VLGLIFAGTVINVLPNNSSIIFGKLKLVWSMYSSSARWRTLIMTQLRKYTSYVYRYYEQICFNE